MLKNLWKVAAVCLSGVLFGGIASTGAVANPPKHNVTVTRAGTGTGTVKSSPAGINCGSTCTHAFEEGISVTLTATPAAGSAFVGWSGGPCDGYGEECFVYVAEALSVTAEFVPTHTLTVTRIGSGTGTVYGSVGGIECGAICSASFPQGAQVELYAYPEPESVFAGWAGGGCSGTETTCTVSVDADTIVKPEFVAKRALSVTLEGTGEGVVEGLAEGGAQSLYCYPGSSSCTETFAEGTSVTLTATPYPGSTFAGWSGGGCSGTGACVVAVDADTSVTATFAEVPKHALTVNQTGAGSGYIYSEPYGINCGPTCVNQYEEGTEVTLTATPSGGSRFTGWSGSGCSGTSQCVVKLTNDRTVTATFAPIPHYTLIVAHPGSGSGNVVSTPPGISCLSDCSESYEEGTSVTLSAYEASGSKFIGWSGGGCSGTGTCTVVMSEDTTVTANFSLWRTLTVETAGGGYGLVKGSTGLNCSYACSTYMTDGSEITLTATASSESTFTGWSGGGCSGTGSCTVVISGDTTVTAHFVPHVTLNVTATSGTGTGKVESSPAGIACSSYCSATYDSGTEVKLTATPDSGSNFAGWTGGGCSGTGTCTTTVTSSTYVYAKFNSPQVEAEEAKREAELKELRKKAAAKKKGKSGTGSTVVDEKLHPAQDGKIVVHGPDEEAHLRVKRTSSSVIEIHVHDPASYAGCQLVSGHNTLSCPIKGIKELELVMGPLSDKVEIESPLPFPVTAHLGAGEDKFIGNDEPDTCYSEGTKRNRCIGGGGNDICITGNLNSDCVGGPGNDYCKAGAGSDGCFGGPGNDICIMGAGNDGCHGGPGNDRLYGGPGLDQLYGGEGYDYCDGGPGKGRSHECEAGPGG